MGLGGGPGAIATSSGTSGNLELGTSLLKGWVRVRFMVLGPQCPIHGCRVLPWRSPHGDPCPGCPGSEEVPIRKNGA